jgi:ribosomal protein L10
MTTTTTLRSEPRADKVAIVEEITAKLNDSVAVFVSEYRGTVGRPAGGPADPAA